VFGVQRSAAHAVILTRGEGAGKPECHRVRRLEEVGIFGRFHPGPKLTGDHPLAERRTLNAERRTPNAERRTPNAERRTPNAERRTPNAER
jgi:hypothetical protein